jgi:hypothetical protein
MFNPLNAYWFISGGGTAQVWASNRLQFVPVADSQYAAWLAQGYLTKTVSAADLVTVMQQQAVPLLQAPGVAVVSIATPALNGSYAVDPITTGQITSIVSGINAGKGVPGSGATFNWQNVGGTAVPFGPTDFVNLGDALMGYLYEFDQALVALISGQAATLPTTPVTIP